MTTVDELREAEETTRALGALGDWRGAAADTAKQQISGHRNRLGDEKFHAEEKKFVLGPCDQPSDNGPQGRVEVSVRYRVHDLDPAKLNEYFDALRAFWSGHGHTVLDDSRPKDWYLWVQQEPDEFQFSLQANKQGELFLGGVTPCLWPNGNPPD